MFTLNRDRTMKAAHLIPLLMLGLTACARETTPRWDQQFGTAVRAAQQRQHLPATTHPPMTLDGVMAEQIVDNYQHPAGGGGSSPTPPITMPATGGGR